MKREEVSHKGRIVEITPQFTTVEIISESACSACHAKSLCSLGESTAKAISLPTSAWDNYSVGDEVEVVLKASMGHKAVWIGYALPLAVLVVVLLAVSAAGGSELASGLAAIAAVCVYYFVIWLLRNTLRNEFVFSIKKQ
ncbi:MAG: SoxR reducing system RseC family protein [Bacteroidales bacterium]|nr:SoxR reducing system RseC family protein [Candidatus Cryptobacteroides aphodequi]